MSAECHKCGSKLVGYDTTLSCPACDLQAENDDLNAQRERANTLTLKTERERDIAINSLREAVEALAQAVEGLQTVHDSVEVEVGPAEGPIGTWEGDLAKDLRTTLDSIYKAHPSLQPSQEGGEDG